MPRLFVFRYYNRIVIACDGEKDEFCNGYHVSKVGNSVFFMYGKMDSNSEGSDLNRFRKIIKKWQQSYDFSSSVDAHVFEDLKTNIKESLVDGIYGGLISNFDDFDGVRIPEPSTVFIRTLNRHCEIGRFKVNSNQQFVCLNCLDEKQNSVRHREYKCPQISAPDTGLEKLINEFEEINSIAIKEWEELEFTNND